MFFYVYKNDILPNPDIHAMQTYGHTEDRNRGNPGETEIPR